MVQNMLASSTREKYAGYSHYSFMRRFPDERTALREIFAARFPEGLECPNCGRDSPWYQMKRNRKFGHSCGRQISVLAGTIMNKTQTSVLNWLYAMLSFINTSDGLPISTIRNQLGISHKAAFRICNHIRLQMAISESHRKIGANQRPVYACVGRQRGIRYTKSRARGWINLMSFSDGQFKRTGILPLMRSAISRRLMRNVCMPDATLVTDDVTTFGLLTSSFRRPHLCRLLDEDGAAHCHKKLITDQLGSTGHCIHTFHGHISRENAWLYLAEHDFRYNEQAAGHSPFESLIASLCQIDDVVIARARACFDASLRSRSDDH